MLAGPDGIEVLRIIGEQAQPLEIVNAAGRIRGPARAVLDHRGVVHPDLMVVIVIVPDAGEDAELVVPETGVRHHRHVVQLVGLVEIKPIRRPAGVRHRFAVDGAGEIHRGIGIVEVQTTPDHILGGVRETGILELRHVLARRPGYFLAATRQAKELFDGNAEWIALELAVDLPANLRNRAILLLLTQEEIREQLAEVRIRGAVRQLLVQIDKRAPGVGAFVILGGLFAVVVVSRNFEIQILAELVVEKRGRRIILWLRDAVAVGEFAADRHREFRHGRRCRHPAIEGQQGGIPAGVRRYLEAIRVDAGGNGPSVPVHDALVGETGNPNVIVARPPAGAL